ncbi:hemicentin-1-like isoform X7 [Dreissena polymorpha]|uniref:hemicentin-1-like isoform X7 n=1 Tax=Dreissena polymorpha TaxID=45954 RepID=UPI0022655DAB|nr:hemicentin-1-like isoform X7 [Dreissena polymorpha]
MWLYQLMFAFILASTTAKACGPPPEIANGTATLRMGLNITTGSFADVHCNPGYMSKPTIACLSNNSWEQVTCELSEIDFGAYGTEASAKTETNFFVTCKLDSSIPSANMATYKWFKVDNTEVTSRDSITRVYVVDRRPGLELNLEPVQDDDTGHYRCVASVGSQTFERQLFLAVRATITFNDCPTEQFGMMGNRSEILCSASGGEGTLSTEWRKEGVVGTLGTNNEYALENKNLVVLHTTAASAGLYTFYASASTEKKSQRITFRAVTIPLIVQPLMSKKAVVGNTAELFCTARGTPSPRIDWFKVDEKRNEVRMQTDSRVTIEERTVDGDTQGIMMIKNVQKEDESLYACKAYNKATEILNSATIPETQSYLDVQTIPSIGEYQDTVNGQYQGREGASVTMKCKARGNPRPVVVWTKVGSNHQYTEGQNSETVSVTKEDIADPNKPGVKLSLDLKGLEASADGIYTCIARNEAGEVSKNVKLEVLFSPNFDGQDTEYGRVFYTWKGNTDGKVVCVVNGNPQPIFNWYKDGTEIVRGTSGYGLSEEKSADPRYPYRHISKLSVAYNGANDNIFGTYTCKSTNNIKPNNQTLQLERAGVSSDDTSPRRSTHSSIPEDNSITDSSTTAQLGDSLAMDTTAKNRLTKESTESFSSDATSPRRSTHSSIPEDNSITDSSTTTQLGSSSTMDITAKNPLTKGSTDSFSSDDTSRRRSTHSSIPEDNSITDSSTTAQLGGSSTRDINAKNPLTKVSSNSFSSDDTSPRRSTHSSIPEDNSIIDSLTTAQLGGSSTMDITAKNSLTKESTDSFSSDDTSRRRSTHSSIPEDNSITDSSTTAQLGGSSTRDINAKNPLTKVSSNSFSSDDTSPRRSIDSSIPGDNSITDSLTTAQLGGPSTMDITAKNPLTKESTDTVGVGIGVAGCLLCVVGAVVVIILL